ncbi:MAG: hypothetical protein IPL79_16310 [Myxococcales bacterium]|nr:hypothetical protein [Myxococcales bacterium]
MDAVTMNTYVVSGHEPAPVAPTRSLAGMASELQTLRLLPKLARAAPSMRALPRGDNSLVIDIPGMYAPEVSMAPLRAFLRRLGYDARGWGVGFNHGRPGRDIERLSSALHQLRARDARPIHLIGQSLGGVIAREISRRAPELITTVTTFGTPAIGGPTFTLAAKAFGQEESQRIAQQSAARDRDRPIEVPVLAMFSKRDVVVHWPACLDHTSRRVVHVEIDSPHLGMIFDPEVWRHTALHLAAVPRR